MSATSPYYAGLDVGGTSIKSILVDGKGQQVGEYGEVKSHVKEGYTATFQQLDLALEEICEALDRPQNSIKTWFRNERKRRTKEVKNHIKSEISRPKSPQIFEIEDPKNWNIINQPFEENILDSSVGIRDPGTPDPAEISEPGPPTFSAFISSAQFLAMGPPETQNFLFLFWTFIFVQIFWG